jgi:hypothetical protein
MTFKIGDRVRCVKGYRSTFPPHAEVVIDQFYLIEEVAHTVRVHGVDAYWCVERFELVKAANPHKWAKEIKAWADGAEIEWRCQNHDGWTPWRNNAAPSWAAASTHEYRVKPEKKPDVVCYMRATCPPAQPLRHHEANDLGLMSWATRNKTGQDNIECTFDGETGKLKAVQLLSN